MSIIVESDGRSSAVVSRFTAWYEARMTRTFRLAARAAATAILADGEEIRIRYEQGAIISLCFRTRYLDRGHQVRIPGQLELEAVGETVALDAAASVFTNAGRDVASFLALSSNAAIAPLEPEVIYDVSPGQSRREHFQRYVAPDEFAFTSRFIDVEASTALLNAVAMSPERNRLVRATSHYCEALRDWRVGSELLALSHLFMGVEAMKTASLRHLLSTRDVSREVLAAEWGYEDTGRLTQAAFLDQEARVRLVFQGDGDCHRLARTTSDSFEHGLENAGKLYKPAGECLAATAAYLRQAIVQVSSPPESARKIILGERFQRPRGPAGVDNYLRSTLVATDADLAAMGRDYPHYDWQPGIKNAAFDASIRRYTFQPNHVLKPMISAGVTFENISYEGWDRSLFTKAVDRADKP